MKRFLLILVSLLTIGSMYANCNLYIEDFEIQQGQREANVAIKAHFDHYVSGMQINLTLPEGVTVTHAFRTEEVIIEHLNESGNRVSYLPSVNINQDNTRYIVLSSAMDYEYDGTAVGVAKYDPSDYTFFQLDLDIDPNFKGGDIHVESVTACGADTRSWVTRCDCPYSELDTHISVEGVEPEPVDPHDIGYWLVLGDGRYIEMESNYIYIRLINASGSDYALYHFRIDGKDYGASYNGRPTDMEDLENNKLYKVWNNFSIEKGAYVLCVCGRPEKEQCYVYAHIDPDGGGFDDVEELIGGDRQVANVRYFDINGREMAEPHGLTIVVTTYTDGSHNSAKILQR